MSMGAVEAGRLVISVTADTDPAKKEIEGELPKSGDTAGKKTSGFLGKALKVGAVGTGIAVAGILGTGIAKGFERLSAIDQATAKLKGLGHSAKGVQQIMDNALASVKGTAFGLGDAATQAAALVAAGVKPGKDLTKTLKIMGDTATIAGTSLQDMGGVFGDIAAKGNLTGDEAARLLERGIPIFQMLGKHYKVSAEAAKEMVSEGEVSFKQFKEIMEDNIGGAALKSGDTFHGAMQNVGAAMSRFGASLIGPVFSKIPKLFGNIITAIDGVTPQAGKLGEAIGGLFSDLVPFIESGLKQLPAILPTIISVFEKFVGVLRAVVGVVSDAVGWLIQNRDILIPIAGIVLAMVAGWKAYIFTLAAVKFVQMAATAAQLALNAALTANPIGLIVMAVAGLIAVLVVLFKKNEGFRNFVIGAWEKVKDVVSGVVDWFKNSAMPVLSSVWEGIKEAVAQVWPVIKMVFGWVVKYIQFVWGIYSKIFQGILWVTKNVIGWIADMAWPILKTVFGWIVKYVQFMWNIYSVAWKAILGVVREFVNWFTVTAWPIIKKVFEIWVSYLGILWDGFKVAWNGILSVVETVVGWFMSYVAPTLGLVWDAVSGAVSRLWEFLTATWEAIKWATKTSWEAIKSSIIDPIRKVWDNSRSIFTSVKDFLASTWNNLKAGALITWNAIRDHIIDPIRIVWQRLQDIVTNIKTWLSNAWTLIKDRALSAWQNVRDAIIDPISRAWDRLGVIVDSIRENLSGAWSTIKNKADEWWGKIKTAIISPLSDLWSQFKEFLGVNDKGDGIVEGKGALGKLVSAFSAVVTAIRGAFSGIKDAIKDPIITAFKWINKYVIDRINTDVLSKFGGNLEIGHLPEEFAKGGLATGPKSGYFVTLHGTEYVMNERATKENLGLLHAMNSGRVVAKQLGAAPQTASPVQSARSPGSFDPGNWVKALFSQGAKVVINNLAEPAMDWLRGMVGGTVGGEMGLGAIGSFMKNVANWADDKTMSTGMLGEALYKWMKNIEGDTGYYQECLATIHKALDALAGQFGYTTGALISTSPHPNAIISALGSSAFNKSKAPRGALTFWGGGTYGHIAVSTGIDSQSINNYAHDIIEVVPNIGTNGYVGWLPPQRFVSGGKFDSGGMLQPGWNAAYNGTGKPEPVLTDGQWKRISGLTQSGSEGPRIVNNWTVQANDVPTMDSVMNAWSRYEALQGL